MFYNININHIDKILQLICIIFSFQTLSPLLHFMRERARERTSEFVLILPFCSFPQFFVIVDDEIIYIYNGFHLCTVNSINFFIYPFIYVFVFGLFSFDIYTLIC